MSNRDEPTKPPAKEKPESDGKANPKQVSILNSSSQYTIVIDPGIFKSPDAKPTIAFLADGTLVINIGPLKDGIHTVDERDPPDTSKPTRVTKLNLKIKSKS